MLANRPTSPSPGRDVIVMKIGVGLGSACFIANFAKGKTRKTRSKLGPLHQAIAESFSATGTAFRTRLRRPTDFAHLDVTHILRKLLTWQHPSTLKTWHGVEVKILDRK